MTIEPSAGSQSPLIESPIKVAVLMGGVSREREVSIQSGRCVEQALKEAGVNVVTADIAPDRLDILDDKSINIFFIALHGTFGEDGALQEILESKNLIYTGSGPQASQLAFDKWKSKEYFTKAGAPSPDAILFDPNKGDEIEDIIWRLGQKYVIKPLREGSTIGIAIADNPNQAVAAARKCAAEFGDCMIEEFVPGREITVGILGKDALPILEIRARGGFYDYQAKYLDDKTEYLFDTINDAALVARIQKSAVDCFNVLGCHGVARVDFILHDEGIPYVLEVNSIPGLTSHSLLPKAAAKIGLSMSDLCIKIIEAALENRKTKYPSRDPARQGSALPRLARREPK
jgi:D-alanine-D-alanine ligase